MHKYLIALHDVCPGEAGIASLLRSSRGERALQPACSTVSRMPSYAGIASGGRLWRSTS